MIYNCYSCKIDKHKINYSKRQLKRKTQESYPRCKECIAHNSDCKEVVMNVSNNVPPKRLVMIPENECDFCNYDFKSNTTMEFIDFNLYPNTGWQVCDKCNHICHKNLAIFSINISILKKEFQDYNFKVERSDGTIELDWYIAGNAIREDVSYDFRITIVKKSETNTLTKSLFLDLLRKWQL